MQVQFNKPVTIGANTYGKGQHEVPAADVKDNWFFDALVKDGSAVVLRAEEGEAVAEVANDAPDAAPEHSEEAPEHSEEAPATKAKAKTKAGAKESGDA